MSRVWTVTGWALALGAAVYAAAQRQDYTRRLDRVHATADEYLRLAVEHAGESGRRGDEAQALRELADKRLARLAELVFGERED